MFSAVFLYLAIALWHRALKSKCCSENFYIVLSGAATAIAVSIRPNYLFALPAFAMFSIVDIMVSRDIAKYSYAGKQIGSFVLGLGIVTLIQFVPYFFYPNGPAVLLTGLLALGHFSLPGTSFTKLATIQLLDQKVVSFYLFVYSSVGFLLFVVLNRNNFSTRSHQLFFSGVLTCIVSIVGLNYSFMVVHFWEFYSLMFVPYAAILFTYLCIFVFETNTVPLQESVSQVTKKWLISSIIVGALCFLVSHNILHKSYDLMFRIQTKGLSINDRRIDQGLVDFLKLYLENGISFYVPANVIYHRLLSHERIGDGHSWMLYYVLSGKRVGPVDDIFLYSVRSP